MIDDHWFDALNKRLAESAPRRGLLSVAATLSIVRHLGAQGAAGKGGGKGRKRGNGNKDHGKGNGNKKPKPPKPFDSCAANFRSKRNRKHCRFIRRQCDGDDPRDFCIEQLHPSDDKVARCCAEANPKCCGRHCCKANANCCKGVCCGDASSSEFQCCNDRCIDTSQNSLHCGRCGNECPVGQFCEEGRCLCRGGPCDPACPVGLTYCDGECVDTKTDPRHCGGCNAFNPNNLKCCDGNPCTYVDGVCCGGTCYPSYWPSCE